MDWLLNTWVFKTLIRPTLDVALLTFLIYQGYRILFQTRAIALIRGLILMILVYLSAATLRLDTVVWILNILAPGLFIGLAIVFQPELRKIFTQIGQGGWFSPQTKPKSEDIEAVLTAAEVLSGMRRGALIVFARKVGLKNIIDRATSLDAEISTPLLLSIFQFDTPLHDGGVVLQGGRIVSAGCFFPISEQTSIKKNFGTRHRAALGLAEDSDAVILIVSEETGALSLAYNGALHYDLSTEECRHRLQNLLEYKNLDLPEEGENREF